MPDTAPSGAVIHDSFDGSGNLNAHTPDIPFASSSWINSAGFPFNATFTLSGGSVTAPDDGTYVYQRSTTDGFIGFTTDYDVHVGHTFVSGSPALGIDLFLEPRGFERHILHVTQGGALITDYGGSTVNIPWVNPLSNGTPYHFIVRVTAANVRLICEEGGETLSTVNTTGNRSLSAIQISLQVNGSLQFMSLSPAAGPPPEPPPPTEFWTKFVNTREVV